MEIVKESGKERETRRREEGFIGKSIIDYWGKSEENVN